MLRKLVALAVLCVAGMVSSHPAKAQSFSIVELPGGCGTGNYANSLSYLTVDSTMKLCVNASVSASITGFPGTSQTTGTPISVTTGGVTGTLPSGTVVVASNVGATNGAYCKLGASATTSDQLIPPNSWFAFTVGSNTQLTCITSTSTTTVNMVGGSGLPTGSGGGGGGGSGGTVAQGNAGSNAQAWWAQIGDTARGPAKVQAGNASSAADVALTVTDPNVLAAVQGPVAAGTNIIGFTSNDPCTSQLKTNVAIGGNGGNIQLVAGVAAKKVYLCSLFVVGQAAFVGNIIEGTGAACTTANEAAVIGSTTAANGVSLAANNGWVLGNGGATAGVTATTANGLCLLQSGTVALAGNATYVQQ